MMQPTFPVCQTVRLARFPTLFMTCGLTSHVSFLPVTLLSRFSFGTLMLNGKFLQSNLIWQIQLGRQPNCRHSSLYYAGERVLSSPAGYDGIITHV
ncbi:hypothetical protein QQF64_003704 [Cirrhinus molitorella]|uniref:Uncharacterized protein n=1 Tax=Cirrhinus molitorella TaxID=172907 RepID=A0ABR3MM25_9TELE